MEIYRDSPWHMLGAAFVSWALFTAGIPTLKPRAIKLANWGSEVDWRDTANIRKWDVVF